MLFNKKKKYKALKDYCLKKDKHPSIKKRSEMGYRWNYFFGRKRISVNVGL